MENVSSHAGDIMFAAFAVIQIVVSVSTNFAMSYPHCVMFGISPLWIFKCPAPGVIFGKRPRCHIWQRQPVETNPATPSPWPWPWPCTLTRRPWPRPLAGRYHRAHDIVHGQNDII